MKKKNTYTLPFKPFSKLQFFCHIVFMHTYNSLCFFLFYRNLLDRDTFSKSDPSKNIFLLRCCSNAYCTMKYAYQTLKNIQNYFSCHGLLWPRIWQYDQLLSALLRGDFLHCRKAYTITWLIAFCLPFLALIVWSKASKLQLWMWHGPQI